MGDVSEACATCVDANGLGRAAYQNLNVRKGLANGSRGVVVRFTEVGLPVVRVRHTASIGAVVILY